MTKLLKIGTDNKKALYVDRKKFLKNLSIKLLNYVVGETIKHLDTFDPKPYYIVDEKISKWPVKDKNNQITTFAPRYSKYIRIDLNSTCFDVIQQKEEDFGISVDEKTEKRKRRQKFEKSAKYFKVDITLGDGKASHDKYRNSEKTTELKVAKVDLDLDNSRKAILFTIRLSDHVSSKYNIDLNREEFITSNIANMTKNDIKQVLSFIITNIQDKLDILLKQYSKKITASTKSIFAALDSILEKNEIDGLTIQIQII